MGIVEAGGAGDVKARRLIAFLRGMNDRLNIPHRVKSYGANSRP